MYIRVELLHCLTTPFNFWGTARSFSKAGVLFYIPSRSPWVFEFLHTLAKLIICRFCYNCATVSVRLVFHYNFNLHFSDRSWCWTSFHVLTGHSCIFYSEPLPILKLDLLFNCKSSLCILEISAYQINDLQIYFPCLWLVFSFFWCFISKTVLLRCLLMNLSPITVELSDFSYSYAAITILHCENSSINIILPKHPKL